MEKVAMFGDTQNLVGVLTLPGLPQHPASDTAFLLLNAGVIHRVGPNRLNVTLARRLGTAGITAMRFDLAGIGDSRATQSSLPFESQAVVDIRAAMDYLQATRMMRRFVLVGICSGADNAFATARADERVHGLALIDPYVYPTWKSNLRFLLLRLRSGNRIARFLRRLTRNMAGSPKSPGALIPGQPKTEAMPQVRRYVRQTPKLPDFVAGLRCVLDRGGKVMVIYSGGNLRLFNYPGQLDEVLQPFGVAGRIRCHFCPEANHTFTELSAQTRLLDTIVAWASSDR